MVADPSLSAPAAVPSVEQLLVLLAERDALIVALTSKVAESAARVAELEARLGKNSQNSSRPPSSDAFVKPPPRSLRRASGRQPGKQPGDPGFRLVQRPDPDEVRVYVPGVCRGCGDSLHDAAVIGRERRQVFDLPPIELTVIEHQAERRACGCGVVTTATFPAEATAPTCYAARGRGARRVSAGPAAPAGGTRRGMPGGLLRRAGLDRLPGLVAASRSRATGGVLGLGG